MVRSLMVILLASALSAEAGPGGYLADIGPAPPIALEDASGKPFGMESLRGRAVLVSFIYTTCNGTCPATTHNLYRVQQALREAKLWGTRVAFVSVTLDPERDTPEVLARYAKLYGSDRENWKFVTGSAEKVSRVIADWGMWVKLGPSGVLDHPSRIFLVDPRGHRREIYNLDFLTPEGVVDDIRSLLAESPAP